ncbi:MAG: hypothetical protein ACHP84_06585 [Caulobacterales bacterium]
MTRLLAGLSITVLASAALCACAPPHPHARFHWRDSGWGRDSSWDGGSLKTISKLDCPDNDGVLSRTAAAADGQSCAYAIDGGGVVELKLVKLAGADVAATLKPVEDQLRGEVTVHNTSADHADVKDEGDVNIDAPGVHIHAGSGGANVETNGATVKAGDGGVEIRTDEHGDGVRKILLLVSETPGPHGYKIAGYEARGPSDGPLVVATVMERNDDHRDDVHRAVSDLLRHNLG